MASNQNHIHIGKDWGLFLGTFSDNKPHSHYAIQLSIPLHGELALVTENDRFCSSNGMVIQSNISHQLNCDGNHLLLLLNPTSRIGHYLQVISESEVATLNDPIIDQLKEIALQLLADQDFNHFTKSITDTITDYGCQCQEGTHLDARILKGMDYLEAHSHRVVSLEEVAAHCFLSPSRFLHLFKESMNTSFRKAQIWTRTRLAFTALKNQSITASAYEFGFADGAHFSKAFKQQFGFSPKKIQQL
ncbi:AraC family transcriptional regulator [Limibacter armeniacum]|uniref:helix-turn-helix domain-containing protein n=1 Tax=Limibacter armeniacum TaxID=466084 RepID=UPI002FE5E3C1